MEKSDFFVQPHFAEYKTAEPSLHDLIYRYYSRHFDHKESLIFAERYIEQMTHQETTQI